MSADGPVTNLKPFDRTSRTALDLNGPITDMDDFSHTNITKDANMKTTECPMKCEVKALVYWRNPLRSAAVLTILLSVQICFACLSAISIAAYTGFILLVSVNMLRLYYHYIAKTDSPLIKDYLDRDITLPKDRISDVTHRLVDQAEKLLIQAREVFLLTNFGASVKFGLLLYLMTYVGAHFNFLTLCIIGTLLAFSVPKFYEAYQPEIDRVVKTVKEKSEHALSRVNAQLDKLPILGSRKTKSQ